MLILLRRTINNGIYEFIKKGGIGKKVPTRASCRLVCSSETIDLINLANLYDS